MNPQRPQAVVVMSRCRHSAELFGIRIENKIDKWTADWAFATKDASARREGYDQTRITGKFGVDAEYPGCPHCAARSFFKCNCGKVACWDESRQVKCPWCHQTIQLTTQIESLDAGGDRLG